MKHIKTFESFISEGKVNEMYNPGIEENTFLSILRGVDPGSENREAGTLKPNGSNLDKWIEDDDEGAMLLEGHYSNEENPVEAINAMVQKLFGGWAGTANFAIGPDTEGGNPEEDSSIVEELIKKGFKFFGDVNIDGYSMQVVGKKKITVGDLNVNKTLKVDDYMNDVYGEMLGLKFKDGKWDGPIPDIFK
jgi:hypothetical protein